MMPAAPKSSARMMDGWSFHGTLTTAHEPAPSITWMTAPRSAHPTLPCCKSTTTQSRPARAMVSAVKLLPTVSHAPIARRPACFASSIGFCLIAPCSVVSARGRGTSRRSRSRRCRQDLAGIQDVFGIECLLDQAHQRQLLGRARDGDVVQLAGADAMLPRDRAAEFCEAAVNQVVNLVVGVRVVLIEA